LHINPVSQGFEYLPRSADEAANFAISSAHFDAKSFVLDPLGCGVNNVNTAHLQMPGQAAIDSRPRLDAEFGEGSRIGCFESQKRKFRLKRQQGKWSFALDNNLGDAFPEPPRDGPVIAQSGWRRRPTCWAAIQGNERAFSD
jgi:hypothetical protein